MDYENSKKWLDSLENRMHGFDLANMQKICMIAKLDTAKLKTIHVAGSNGKGSTCAYIANILKQAKYKTGLYTSPHLIEPTERMQINGAKISQQDFAGLAEYFREIIEQNKIDASFFEAITAIALKHFIDENVDFLVAETGMGGRLDATNVLTGIVCVITPISLEHTQYLGDTVEKIAAEKAGIIKKGSIVVVSPKNSAMEIFVQMEREQKLKILSPAIVITSSSEKGSEFDIVASVNFSGMKISMAGEFQCENASLAAAAAIALREKGFDVSKTAIRNGLAKTHWRGRLEIIREHPKIVMDAAHNPDGWEKIAQSMALFKYKKLILVFGAMKDKDINGAKILAALADETIITRPETERAQSCEKIGQILGRGTVIMPPSKALEAAISKAGASDLVLVTGSLYLIGEAYRHFDIEI